MPDPTPTTSAERDVYVPLDSGGTGSAGAEWARREQVRDVFDAASRSVVPPSAERVAALEAVAEAARFVTPTAQLYRYANLAANLATLDEHA